MTVQFASASTDLAANITALSLLLGGMWVVIRLVLSQAAKDRDADRAERQALTKAIETMATAGHDQAKATEEQTREIAKGNREAEKRNGHLAEITVQSRDQVIQAVQQVNVQHVVSQTVGRATVKDERIENEHVDHKD